MIANRLFVIAALALLVAQTGGHAQAPADDALPLTRSYFVTGNYVVGGVDLLPASQSGGFITGTIPMSGVPANADILAAFLYWETISTVDSSMSGALFRGQPMKIEQSAAMLPDPTTAPCWSSGGGSNAQYKLTTHRADVRRLLPVQLDAQGNKTGKRLVNDADLVAAGGAAAGFGPHTVTLPEAGTGNQLPSSAGASLLVIYRDVREDVSSAPGVQPPALTSILLYDGLHLQLQGASTKQTIRGFMQSAATHNAKLSIIAGHGAKNPTERLWFGKTNSVDPSNLLNSNPANLVASNPFFSASTAASDRGFSFRTWPDPAFPLEQIANNANKMPGEYHNKEYGQGYGEQVRLMIDRTNNTPYDCLATAAIIFSTAVQDTDDDGLVDVLEDSASALKDPQDPTGESLLPHLSAMGADSTHKDIFVEIGAMYSRTGWTNPAPGHTPGPHTHVPDTDVFRKVGDAFWCAGTANCDAKTTSALPTNGIRVHFDAGDSYPAYSGSDAYAERYMIRGDGLARGGELILEQPCVPTPVPPPPGTTEIVTCQFPDYWGTVTWKYGFQSIKEAVVHDDGTQADEAFITACKVPGANCRRRFDHARKDIFRYGVYAHAWGIPVSPFPCLIWYSTCPNGGAARWNVRAGAQPRFPHSKECRRQSRRNWWRAILWSPSVSGRATPEPPSFRRR